MHKEVKHVLTADTFAIIIALVVPAKQSVADAGRPFRTPFSLESSIFINMLDYNYHAYGTWIVTTFTSIAVA